MRNRSGFGWLEFVLGILMIGLGILTFIRPRGMMNALVVLYAVIVLLTGISDILFYVRTERYTGFGPIVALIAGIVSVMTGMMLLIYPDVGEWILYLLLPMWFIAHNIFNLANLNVLRFAAGDFCYYVSLIVSVVGLVLGFLMILHPFRTAYIVSILIGIHLILTGANCIVIALGKNGLKS
ncbi:MAG: DUF308 domain-containing protein [Clostridiales bacterium]|nr:DUF308 domain-containing protein [Clostridiales bacterium]